MLSFYLDDIKLQLQVCICFRQMRQKFDPLLWFLVALVLVHHLLI